LAWVLSALLFASGNPIACAQEKQPAPPAHNKASAPAPAPAPQIPADQLDALVAPVALYPDQMLSQVLVASTYPLEIVQAQQWVQQNSNLKGSALADAAKKQDWDPSIQAMVAFPDLLKRLSDNIKYTTDLGNAFLAQQSDVMDAIQRMRRKAQDSGKLASTEQQVVETRTEENKTVVVIQPSNPEVVYVPSYNPEAVWGPPAYPSYPYPPYSYPPYGGYLATAAISFGVGMAVGAIWGGGWGWGMGWGGNDININNNFINRNNFNNVGNVNRSGNRNTWQHNPQHRGGAPYSNRDVANRYGGTARGDSLANRQASARQQQRQSPQRGTVGDRAGGARPGDRPAGGARPGDRPAGGARPGDRPAGAGRTDLGAGRGSAGADRIGSRDIPRSDRSSQNRSAFGGISSGNRARANTSQGLSSMGSSRGASGQFARSGSGSSRGGGGFSRGGGSSRSGVARGGGGRGGGGRGGGGRRR
jgi:hypothetical protein